MTEFRMGVNDTGIDCFVKERAPTAFLNVKSIPGKSQYALVIADIVKRKIRIVIRKTCAERRKITLLKNVMIRKRFEEKVIKLIGVGGQHLSGHFKDGILKAHDEVCGKKREGRSKGDT